MLDSRFSSLVQELEMTIECNELIDRVAKRVGILPSAIVSKRRSKVVADARAAVMYILKVYGKYSLHEIADTLERDHSTVHAAVKRALNSEPGEYLYDLVIDIEEYYLDN